MIKDQKLDSLPVKAASRLNWRQFVFSPNGFLPFAVLVFLFVAFSFIANNFFTVRSVLNLLVQTSTFTILAIGETLVLVVGCIDFSVGAVIAFGATAVLMFIRMGMPIWAAIIAACLVCGIVGLINGILVAKLRLPSFIITFAMAMLVPGISRLFRTVMGAIASPALYSGNRQNIGDLAMNPVLKIVSHDASGADVVLFPGISWIIIIMVCVAVLSHLFLAKTRFGRYVYLVGNNPTASFLSGIKVVRIKILAFVFASMMAGLTGVLLASRLGGPPGGAAGYEMIAIEGAMIGGASISGGTGNIRGTVVGSFIIGTLTMGLQMTNANHLQLPMFLNGLVLLGAVYLDQRQKQGGAFSHP